GALESGEAIQQYIASRRATEPHGAARRALTFPAAPPTIPPAGVPSRCALGRQTAKADPDREARQSMQGPQANAPAPAGEPAADRRRDRAPLALLLALATALHAWLLVNTEVAARDSIGFIRY